MRIFIVILLFIYSFAQAENKPIYVIEKNDMDKSLTVGELFLLMDSGLMVERSENKSYNTVLNKIKATDHKIVSKDDKMITVEMEKGKHNSVYLVIYYFENQLLSRGPKIYKKNE